MKAMDYLVEKNIIKYIWVSNFNVKQLKEAQSHTKNKIVANQIEYNLVTRTVGEFESCTHIESETIPYCQNNDIIIVAYRPIERGVLLKNHPLLDNLSKKYSKTKSQIAINWLISKKNIITIPKSLNKVHLIENLWALWWKLEDEDMRLLDETDFNWLKLL
jgi:diketogulonate reductase-like aldo/keto reductase